MFEDADTIEFQEIIPGITPPKIPLLIKGLENLPMLPGFTIRNSNGTVLGEGAKIPTTVEEIPSALGVGPQESLSYPYLGEYLTPPTYSPPPAYSSPVEDYILETTEGNVEEMLTPDYLADEPLEIDDAENSDILEVDDLTSEELEF